MSRSFVVALVGMLAVAGTAMGQNSKDLKPSTAPAAGQPEGQPEFELPPGMTKEDMEACMLAGTPGEMHAHLAKGVGVWEGQSTMWMTAEAEPMESTCKATISPMLDGRYFKCKTESNMAGMPFVGFGIYGFDNVSQQFQCTWVDNCSTGMATGSGELSSNGESMEWTYTYNCPITKKPTTLRQVERYTGEDTMTMEMYGIDPHSGKEFKMLEVAYTRVSDDVTAEAAASGTH